MTNELPPSPGGKGNNPGGIDPSQLNADLATMAMAKTLLSKLDTPSDISKIFAVRKAVAVALNHKTGVNETWYDSSVRVNVFEAYEKASLNINAKSFNSFMAFMMKPTYVIQGMPNMQQPQDEPGFLARIWSRVTGAGQKQEPQGGQQ